VPSRNHTASAIFSGAPLRICARSSANPSAPSAARSALDTIQIFRGENSTQPATLSNDFT
jgi:hypothetical protein